MRKKKAPRGAFVLTAVTLPVPLRRQLDDYARTAAYGNRSRAATDLLVAGLAALAPKSSPTEVQP